MHSFLSFFYKKKVICWCCSIACSLICVIIICGFTGFVVTFPLQLTSL